MTRFRFIPETILEYRIRTHDIMRVVHIASLGHKEQGRIAYVLQKRGGEKVILVHTPETAGDADHVIKDILQQHGSYEVEKVCVDGWNYHDVLCKVVEVALRHSDCKLRFNPSLGTRVMTAALITVANFTGSVVYLVKEANEKAVGVIDIYPIQKQSLSPIKKDILEELDKRKAEGIASIGKLAQLVGRSMGSVSGHITQLEKWGYVRTQSENKSRHVWITGLGSAVLRMSKQWKNRLAKRHSE